ncbi:type II secretion system F family protein [Vibrio sp. S4M6]|uniref:type II secretion system F family protein n=1 Tax=Vibrio sinus TaxID=2946865 RepID=UPI002029C188|nr:type II secretion system F family protein [Vibrio sinus]MCL9780666.1 type II secretion system F family protein [Vibrio sinus]
MSRLQTFLAKMELGAQQKRQLLDSISEFLEYGISMHAIFSELLPEMYPKGGVRFVIDDIFERISDGAYLSDALLPWFGKKVSATVKSGEASDSLYSALKIAAESTAKEASLLPIFANKLIYPIVAIMMSLVVIEMMKIKLFPSILTLLKSTPLPPNIANYLSYAKFMTGFGFILLALFILLIGIAITLVVHNYTGALRPSLDKLPIFAIYRKSAGAYLLGQLGFYFKSNILLDAALQNILDASPSRYVSMHCNKMMSNIEDGVSNVAYAFDTGLLDNSVMSVMKAMGKVNKIEDNCASYSILLTKEVVETVAKSGKLVGLILLFYGAMNIAWSIESMYATIGFVQTTLMS